MDTPNSIYPNRPTMTKLIDYCDEIGYHSLDPKKFLDYYDNKGWDSVKDWKETVIGWKNRDKSNSVGQPAYMWKQQYGIVEEQPLASNEKIMAFQERQRAALESVQVEEVSADDMPW